MKRTQLLRKTPLRARKPKDEEEPVKHGNRIAKQTRRRKLDYRKKVKRNDKTWSVMVRTRDNYQCRHCGSTEWVQAHHLRRREFWATRWQLMNGIALCAKCHEFSNDFSAHGTPDKFEAWIRDSEPEVYAFWCKSRAMPDGSVKRNEEYVDAEYARLVGEKE